MESESFGKKFFWVAIFVAMILYSLDFWFSLFFSHPDSKNSGAIVAATKPQKCFSFNGLPDLKCSPGEADPNLTKKIICSKKFRTASVRNKKTTEAEKNSLYDLYGISHPKNNRGQTQVCELDHIISLELGGSDSLKNIFPQCGPDAVALSDRYFKQKDTIENRCHTMVCEGVISLSEAQRQIVSDWRRACQ